MVIRLADRLLSRIPSVHDLEYGDYDTNQEYHMTGTWGYMDLGSGNALYVRKKIYLELVRTCGCLSYGQRYRVHRREIISMLQLIMQGGLKTVSDIMQYSVRISRDETHATGTLMSATSVCNKMGLGLGTVITGFVLQLAKYDGAAAAANIAQSNYTALVERIGYC